MYTIVQCCIHEDVIKKMKKLSTLIFVKIRGLLAKNYEILVEKGQLFNIIKY